MCRILSLILLGIGLMSCQSTGSGPLSLSESAQVGYEKYRSKNRLLCFTITEDGRSYGYTYCESGLNCIEDADGAISQCERRTGRICKNYAEFEKVVWRNAQTRSSYKNIGAISLNWYTGSGERL